MLFRRHPAPGRAAGIDAGFVMGQLEQKLKQKILEELQRVEHELNHELPKELMKARAHGDLSENAEYKYAKERQGYLTARLGQLQKRLSNVSMLNLDNLPRDKAAYGSRVVVLDVDKSVKTEYKLVTTEESDATKGWISTTSPIGRALLGRAKGDTVSVVTPAGKKELEIVQLVTIYDED
jgi:transcription elongation factor GreA